MNEGFSQSAPVLLIGANIRFLAESSVRHGHNVFTVDYYGDWDLRKLCPGKSILREGDGAMSLDALIRLAEGVENSGVVYGPGFENDISALAKLKSLGTIMGCSAESVRKARDPETLRRSAMSWNFIYPPVEFKLKESMRTGRWLEKPLCGMGGEGIRFVDDKAKAGAEDVFYQARINGLPSSAAVVSNGSDATVLGIMTQIIGAESFGASGFRYVGNVYPHPFHDETLGQVTTIAEALTLEFDIKGLWGFDFIYNGNVILIEVNPRPSAGLGVIDAVTMNDLLGLHIDSVKGASSSLIIDPGPSRGYTAQARVFAHEDVIFSSPEKWSERGAKDIPYDGELIKAGAPVLTITAAGDSYGKTMAALEDEAGVLYSSLTPATAASSY